MYDVFSPDIFVSTDDLLNDADRSSFIEPFDLLQIELKGPILAYFSYYIEIIFGLNSAFYLYNMRRVL